MKEFEVKQVNNYFVDHLSATIKRHHTFYKLYLIREEI